MPSSPATTFAGLEARGNRPRSSFAAARAVAGLDKLRFHEPRLMGEVTLNSRSMLKKREGRPRSEISSAGLTPRPANASVQADFASFSLPVSSAPRPSPAEAPASPPVKKYMGISQLHTGLATTGRP